MDDLISRQAAIEVADAVWSATGDKNVAKVWDQLKDLPSADVAPVRHGYWKTKDGRPAIVRDGYVIEEAYCSVCGSYLDDSGEYDITGNYCSNCGARMDGEQNETD